MVGMKNPNEPTAAAKDFVEILKGAGLNPSVTKWGNPMLGPPDFDLFICPPAIINPQDANLPPAARPSGPPAK